jgi:hypothetical protein
LIGTAAALIGMKSASNQVFVLLLLVMAADLMRSSR